MQLRIFTEPQQGASYATLLEWAKAADDLGYDAFFRSDHYLKMGNVDGRPGPTDAWITLAGLARETTRVRLGTLVTSATFRYPGPLAVAVAEVDDMSGGRVELGIGAGWYETEHTAYGIPFGASFNERFERLRDQLEIIRGMWTTPDGETFSYEGKHISVKDSPALPKPKQKPHPPIIIGGFGPKRTPRLAVRYADEYNVAFAPLNICADRYATIREECEKAGRDPSGIELSMAQVVCVGADESEFLKRAEAIGRPPDQLRAGGVAGTPDEAVARLQEIKDLGVNRVYLQFLDLADLEHAKLVASEVAPKL